MTRFELVDIFSKIDKLRKQIFHSIVGQLNKNTSEEENNAILGNQEASSLDRIKMTKNLTFVIVNFLYMFTNFGHIHSVIFIQSSDSRAP